jgi:DNA-binding transcriptional LysR family regulator
MHFDLTDLRLFALVAEAGSITGGAGRAHLALASASARIRGLERELGVPLLKRGRRGIELTSAGTSLADHARVVLRQVETLKGELGAFARGLRGTVRVLSNTAAITEHLPDAIAAFLAANPAIDIDIEEHESVDIVDALAAGNADMGIVADTPLPDTLKRYAFRTDRLVVIAPRADALARRRSVWLRDLLDREFVGLAHGSALQNHLAGHAARLGRPLRLRLRVSGFDTICRLVEAGVGIGIVPVLAAERCRRSMAIGIVRLEDPWSNRRLSVCVRDPKALSVPARRLVGHLTRAA